MRFRLVIIEGAQTLLCDGLLGNSLADARKPTEVHFSTHTYAHHGRIGKLSLSTGSVTTPLLYPVVSLVTGSTPRGGGLWKYVLHAHPHALMRQQRPLMSQILHFLDFNVNPKHLKQWRSKTLRAHYMDSFQGLEYSAPIFLDSGGFKLLWNNQIDLSGFGIEATPETVYQLQMDFGGDLIAALDYPLPPGLASNEAKARMQMSQANILSALRELSKNLKKQTFLFMPVHGQDSDSIYAYVQETFKQIAATGLSGLPMGIAIGSLVPLRGAHNHIAIIQMIQAAIAAIPESARDTIPVHVFGVTGSLIPLLVYLGVDSFDSSTYAQRARNLLYTEPNTYAAQPMLRISELDCSCKVCSSISLSELRNAFITPYKRNRPLPNGLYKSKYYADLALHNIEMDFQIVAGVSRALEATSLDDYLRRHVERHPQLHDALMVAAHKDDNLRRQLTRKIITLPDHLSDPAPQREISLDLSPQAFDINLLAYTPPPDKKVLLLIPCSGTKPYSTSQSHRAIASHLRQELGMQTRLVHKVTLSGLYGPVPEEFENEPDILRYDFRLEPVHATQITLLAERIARFLLQHGSHYDICIGYATSRAYRSVFEIAARSATLLTILPHNLRRRTFKEFYRKENLQELSSLTSSALTMKGAVLSQIEIETAPRS